jgi:3-hydroxymyristoyl/3-hydroxydecanoyl-(acyl carrier protein) dehydratase
VTLVPVGEFVVPASHPCLPGHFPGRPVVPGVVLLDAALALVLGRFPGAGLAGLPVGKFLAVVTPGQVVQVLSDLAPTDPCRVAFVCIVDGVTVVRGSARLLGTAA